MAQREIKFRAWDRSMGRYFGSGTIAAFDSPNIVIYPNGHIFELDEDDTIIRDATDQVILEQYTGLKDKNGVEIYEGDIVSALIYGSVEKGVVEYSPFGEWLIGNIRLNEVISGVSVIENIHKNLDLLGGRSNGKVLCD